MESGLSELPLPDQSQANVIRHPRRRRDFILSRTLLRQVLSVYFPRSAHSPLLLSSKGKPYFEQGPYLSLSHTKGLVFLALSETSRLGVDVEEEKGSRPFSRLIHRVGSPQERAHFDRLSDFQHMKEFYRLWVSKESQVKACGVGLSARESLAEDSFQNLNTIYFHQDKWHGAVSAFDLTEKQILFNKVSRKKEGWQNQIFQPKVLLQLAPE